ncbi:PKD domain-containing protein [Halalkalibaculum sp. DA3122]|uniref:PKD domain-containing protein n=1 Tax=Halalkalibaculum sp. DA3122 TaxID=3373607 RepID=UPI00375497DD
MNTHKRFFPIFEEDQVLSAHHLNELRTYLDEQDRMTRSHLVGIGIVCGLEVQHPASDTILLTEGVGVTSRGYLVGIGESECRFIKRYTDKKMTGAGDGDGETAGRYPPFLNPDTGRQINLWELLTSEEKQKVEETETCYPLDWDDGITIEEGETSFTLDFSEYCILLYQEIEDVDTDDCCGDDCDEEGIRREFAVRKLLVEKKDLVRMISRDESTSEDELRNRANICSNLDHLCIERPGYYRDKDLSLDHYVQYQQLVSDYLPIIQQASVRVGQALAKSYGFFKPLLEDHYPESPFPGFDEGDYEQNGLYKLIKHRLSGSPYAIQYAYDFLKDLAGACDEFRDTACEVTSACCPNPLLFERHLMLGPAQPEQRDQRTPFRHYFQPSPVLNDQKDKRSKVLLLFERMDHMVQGFDVQPVPGTDTEIRITPDRTAEYPLSKRSIPYYYNIKKNVDLVKKWSYRKTKIFKSNRIPSYHSEAYNEGQHRDNCTVEALLHSNMQYQNFRVEGHIGKPYEQAVDEIDSMRERFSLPIKVVGVKLGRRFDNTKLTFECRFRDLENLYETFSTELRFLLDEEMQFFRGLEVKKKTLETQKTAEEKIAGEMVEKRAGTSAETGRKEIDDYWKRKEEEGKKETLLRQKIGKMSTYYSPITGTYTYPETKEGTFGYYYDAMVSESGKGQSYLDVILNYDPALIDLNLNEWVFLMLKPAQLANNIQQVLNKIPPRLENLDITELEGSFDTLIQTAVDYKQLLKEKEDSGEKLDGREQIILFRLDKLIYSCSIKKMKKLYLLYQERVDEFKKLNLFSNFAARHSGLEHMAGVPRGGTFVLVYIDRNEAGPLIRRDVTGAVALAAEEVGAAGFAPPTEVKEESGGGAKRSYSDYEKSKLLEYYDAVLKEFSEVASEKEINIEREKIREIEEGVLERIERLPGFIPRDIPPDNVVVADFALPYLCKNDCPELATMVISQINFSLSESRFCKDDKSKYPFVTDPAGGVVEGSAGGVTKEGNTWYFQPSESNPSAEDVQFTYRVNSRTVVFNAKVFDPRADFSFEVSQLDDGSVEVSFYNNSGGAQSYEWDFGDGASSTQSDPVHIYRDYDQDQAIVTLTAWKQECSDAVSKSVEIPRHIETEFDLQPSKEFGEKTYCNTDDRLYLFKTKPAGEEIAGDDVSGVQKQDNKQFFVPKGYAPGEYTFKYLDASIEVKILEGPAAGFESEVLDLGIRATRMKFHYTGKGDIKTYLWVFDGTRYREESPEHTFLNTGGKHRVVLHVISENGCPAEVDQLIEVPFEEEQPGPSDRLTTGFDNRLTRLENYSNPEMDRELFGGENIILKRARDYMVNIRDELKSGEERKKYEEGKKNAEIAGAYSSMLSEATELITEKAADASDEEKTYMYGIYDQQVTQLMELAVNQKKDIATNSKMGQLLKSVSNQVETLKNAGLEMDPRKSLSKSISEIKAVAERTGKRNLAGLLANLEDTVAK